MKSQLLRKENAHDDAIWCVSWRGLRMVTGSACAAQHVRVWNTSAGQDFALTPGPVIDSSLHPLAVVSVSQQRDGSAFVAGSLDGTLVLYDSQPVVVAVDGEAAPVASAPFSQKIISQEPGCAWGASFNPAGGPMVAATGQGGAVYLYDVTNSKKNDKLQTSSKCCSCLSWSHDGSLIAVGGMDGVATVFTVADKKRSQIPAHGKAIRAVRFSGDGRLLITAGDDGCINVRDVEKGAIVASITGHESWVTALDTCPTNPRTLVSAGTDGTVRLWDLSVNSHVRTFAEHHGQCWGVCLNDDGTKAASVGDDKSLIVYSLV